MLDAVRFEIAPYDFAAARRLSGALGVSHPLAQVLLRRGLGDVDEARRFLAGEERHPLSAFGGLAEAAALILARVRSGAAITVHGDYDADGVCSTAILVRALRTLGARVDWYLPSRAEDGYGLNVATVQKLAARGTQLLITADCAITAVDEVAAARAAGMEVVVTDHHSPRADGALPDAPIVHPGVAGYPCRDLCAAGVAYKLAGALLEAAGLDPALADEDLDLVALATVADVVPLRGENRALVRAGLRALAATQKPGLRALMAVAAVDPSGLDARAVAFRLAPRINAAGRLARADAGLELVLTADPDRARAVAEELDAHNHERRDVETRIRFEAEALLVDQVDAPAYVLAADGWHPGVIGIVAARVAERRHRPTVMIAMDGDGGTGSGRSIPAFDLLAGLRAGADHLQRFGGHRAAAGLTIARDEVDAFRAAFQAYASSVLRPDDLVPSERVDAVVGGDVLGLALAEELAQLEPFGAGNPPVTIMVPAAALGDPRPLSEGRHVACTLAAGGARSRAVRFGGGVGLPEGPVDVALSLGLNFFNGTVEPQVVVRHLREPSSRCLELLIEEEFEVGWRRELDARLSWPPEREPPPTRRVLDARGGGIGGLLGDLVSSGDRVLAVTAHAEQRRRALTGRLGGFVITDYATLERDRGVAQPFPHVVAVDPPAHPHLRALLEHAPGAGWTHLAWGEPELDFALRIHESEYSLREPLAHLYRALRAAGGVRGEACEALLRGDGPQPRSAALAGRLVRVLVELGLVVLDRDGPVLQLVPAPARTALERSAAFRIYQLRLEDGTRYLTSTTLRAAA